MTTNTPIERVREALEIACGYTALVADGNTNVPIRKERAADDCRIIGEALSELDGMVLLPIPGWRPLEEWHEDDGYAFWTRFPVCEPYYAGSPLWDDWTPNYYTHFIPMSIFNCLLNADGNIAPYVEGEKK